MENDYVRLSVNNEEEQPQKPQRRSLWRHWKMLSRFQRNLVTMVFVAVVVTLVYYWGLKEQIQLEEKKEELMNPQIHQPLAQRIDQEVKPWGPPQMPANQSVQFMQDADWYILNRPELKPMDEWEKEREEEESLYWGKRRMEEERKMKELKEKEQEDEERLDWGKSYMEEERNSKELKEKEGKRKKEQERQKNEVERRKMDDRRREEKRKLMERELEEQKRREEREIEDRRRKNEERMKALLEEDIKFAEEFRKTQKLKEELIREDERLMQEEKVNKEGRELEEIKSEPDYELKPSTSISPGELKMKEEEERARLVEEQRREQEERLREEQRRLEEGRQRELERKKKEEERRQEEEKQRELKKLEMERIIEERKAQEEEKRRQELLIMTMVADTSNIHKFKLKPVQFAPPSNDRQYAVVSMLKHAWAGYKKYAWGHDHLKPVSQSYHDWFNLGLTIVDGLDTLWIMGLENEFNESKEWVATRLSVSFDEFHDVNLFEVTIRVLGGLLSAYHFSGDPVFLERAMGLGERLLPCFTKSPSAIPFSDVNLASRMAHSPKWSPDSSTSEVTTLQLEFRDLSRCCHNYTFEDVAFKVSEHVHILEKTDGLVPIFINPTTGNFHENTDIKLGARGDSYYEYLLKQWIQTGKTLHFLKDDYINAVEGIKNRLTKRTPQKNLLFIGELKGNNKEFVPKMDHLVCFVPGMLALGVHHGMPEEHMNLAVDLMETCYRTYSERPTFLAPEITFFNYKPTEEDKVQDMYVKTNDAHNLLRPEFIESLWYMWATTGNTTYQNWGWKIFKAFERYTKVADGYTSINNVNNPLDPRPRDMMESFFLSETIKYLYLLFSNDRQLIDVDKWVMNTEGHPLPIYPS